MTTTLNINYITNTVSNEQLVELYLKAEDVIINRGLQWQKILNDDYNMSDAMGHEDIDYEGVYDTFYDNFGFHQNVDWSDDDAPSIGTVMEVLKGFKATRKLVPFCDATRLITSDLEYSVKEYIER